MAIQSEEGILLMTSRRAEIRDIMSRQVVAVREDDTVESVIDLFERKRISGALVVDGQGEYTGVVSKTDLSGRKVLDWVNQDLHLDSMMVREVMGRHKPVTVGETDPVTDAVRLMRDQHIHRVFVTDVAGKITGVVSSLDILKVIEVEEDPLEELWEQREERQARQKEAEKRLNSDDGFEDRITQLILKKQKEIISSGD